MLHDVNIVDKVFREAIIHNRLFMRNMAAVFVRLIGFYEEYPKADFHRFVEILNDSELRKIVMEAAY